MPRRALGVAVAIAALTGAADAETAADRAAAELLIASGVEALRDGDPVAAIERLREAQRLDPGSAEACRQLGAAYRRLGLLERARQEYQQALKLGRPRADVYQDLGVVEAEDSHFLRAAGYFETGVRLDPSKADLRHNLGKAYQELARFDDAAGAFSEALRLNPADQESAAALGNLLIMKGELRRAEQVLHAALEGRPDHAGVCYRLGVALMKENRPAEAVGYLERAVRADPALSGAWLSLAGATRAAGDDKRSREAQARFEDLYRRNRDAETEANQRAREIDRVVPEHFRRGLVLVNESRWEEAIAEFRKILALQPDDAPTLLNVGRLYAAQGDATRAREFLERALAADTAFAEPQVDLARLDRGLGRRPEAIRRLDRALALRPDLGEGWLLKGTLLAETQRWGEAAPALEEAARLLPASPEPEQQLAEVYRRLGRAAEAERAARRAAAKSAGGPAHGAASTPAATHPQGRP
jgi:tetratricopeptide (TPR) repeat protein